MSYASSASVYYLDSIKQPIQSETDVSLGSVPGDASCNLDRFTQLPSLEDLQSIHVQPRFLQLCCEAHIREDNSFLSTIKIGNTQKTVLDLFNLDLSSSVTTLLGAEPGIRALGEGKELQGLLRAVEYAGARSVLVPLWSLNADYASTFLGA